MHIGLFVGVAKLDLTPHNFICLILERFKQRGHSITIITPSDRIPPRLDAGILHVCATGVPAEVAARIPADIPVINRRVLDISKRKVSRMLVSRGESVSGPVIVKSNANYAGLDDLARESGVRRRIRTVAYLLRYGRKPLNGVPYEIYDSVADVPSRVWGDRERVVERFIPEKHGDLYCLRKWVFLGEVEFQVISRSEKPVVKAAGSKSTFIRDPAHPDLVQERERLGFDYGKFDYVMHEGRPVLLDANSTPGISERSSQHMQSADDLARGLEQWVLKRSFRDIPNELP